MTKITIDTDIIQKHFSEGQIQGFMNDLQLSYTETILYLWLFNYVSICPKDLKTDLGRPMYLKFAKGISKIFKVDDEQQ